MATADNQPLPLHELIAHILEAETDLSERLGWRIPALGTMQSLNQRLANQPLLNFFNASLRGGLLGCAMYLLAGLLVGATPNQLYSGFLGYNAVLTAMAIGGMFYAPNLISISLGAICAFLASIVSLLLFPLFTGVKLPILALPFSVVTIGCLLIVQRALPSLVPVSLYTVATPEEHRQRFLVARDIITRFRQQLRAAIKGERHNVLFEQASPEIKGNLRYVFNAIDRDHSGELSTQELAAHLQSAGKGFHEGELTYLFNSMDRDRSGEIDFASNLSNDNSTHSSQNYSRHRSRR